MITIFKLLTGRAIIDLSAQVRGAAVLNRPHRLTMREQKLISIFLSIGSAVFSKEVSEF
jgi:hypothetical protein